MATKMSTKRIVQLHSLQDDFASRVSVHARGAINLSRIGNVRGAAYLLQRGARYLAIASRAARILEARS